MAEASSARDGSGAAVVTLLIAVAALAWVLGTSRLEPVGGPDLDASDTVALD